MVNIDDINKLLAILWKKTNLLNDGNFVHERYSFDNYNLLQDSLARYLNFHFDKVACFAVYFKFKDLSGPKKKIEHIYLSYNLKLGYNNDLYNKIKENEKLIDENEKRIENSKKIKFIEKRDKLMDEKIQFKVQKKNAINEKKRLIREKCLEFFTIFIMHEDDDTIFKDFIHKIFSQKISQFFIEINKKLVDGNLKGKKDLFNKIYKDKFQDEDTPKKKISTNKKEMNYINKFFEEFFKKCITNIRDDELFNELIYIFFLYCDFHILRIYFNECFEFENLINKKNNFLTIIFQNSDIGIYHCETQLAVHLHKRNLISKYIGIAKLSCPVCKFILDCHEFDYRGSHNCLKNSLQFGKWYYPSFNKIQPASITNSQNNEINNDENIFSCFFGWLELIENPNNDGGQINDLLKIHKCKKKNIRNGLTNDDNFNYGRYCQNISSDMESYVNLSSDKPLYENLEFLYEIYEIIKNLV